MAGGDGVWPATEKRVWFEGEAVKQDSRKDSATATALTHTGVCSGGEAWSSSHGMNQIEAVGWRGAEQDLSVL